MPKVLVLGAGLVSRPLVRYLLDKPDFKVTCASRTVSKAVKLVDGHPDGEAISLNTADQAQLEDLIKTHDVAVSLLPATEHVLVAKMCIAHRTTMVTTSYVSSEMKALDAEAKAAGVTILNELGVDPGIDHMSAMRIIHGVEKKGGKVTSFKSYCGGLPAPEANDNPLGYKFSWSPRAVLVAATNSARYRKNGEEVQVDGKNLFGDSHVLDVEGLGQFEAYPNRDSMGYVDLYGLEGIDTMFRGTLRNLGHCDVWLKWSHLGLFDQTERADLAGGTFAGMMGKLAGTDATPDAVAAHLRVAADAPIIEKLVWLDLFSDQTVPDGLTAPIDIVGDKMLEKCPYGEAERDMIVLAHQFEAAYPDGKKEGLSSTLIDFGIPNGDSSMARTVSLPAAIATRLVADGTIKKPGVHIPVEPDLYDPILNELETLDIACKEKSWEI